VKRSKRGELAGRRSPRFDLLCENSRFDDLNLSETSEILKIDLSIDPRHRGNLRALGFAVVSAGAGDTGFLRRLQRTD
jgi:hypothetical protein